ncbi:MAG TPA: V-type ATPase 116kDa subunit family protein [Tenuifilaceae bacterium]|nr:V-type ATPase 116kDa subunit family protein [Tenuifilaceae bacterium]HPJ45251.1 V-type ATPase 116kDa subunit family protein [Tenuifilaceae bacterium]HRX67543.1 V-type ATPase 116kDa subunit family protein [Tenuifilaceae bacterium]
MIVPMIKYAFLVYHRDFEGFLQKLQELGMVDIVRQERPLLDDERTLMSQINRYTSTIRELKTLPQIEPSSEEINPDSILNQYDELLKEKEQVEGSIRKVKKELTDVRPWGRFDTSLLQKITGSGLKLRFFITNEKTYSEDWEREYPIQVINREAGQVYFVCITNTDEQLSIDANEVRAPQYSYSDKEKESESLFQQLQNLTEGIQKLTSFVPQLETAKLQLVNKLEFTTVQQSADKEAENTLLVLQGWVPEPKNKQFVEFIESENIIFISERAQKTDDAPILLKNNKFAKLFEPIGSLFTNPTYGELDLTPFFAPFFMMFFGFCLGDAGYGLVMFIGATVYKLKASKDMRPLMSLVQWLSISTVIFGTITGTLFGIELVKVDLPLLEKFRNLFLDQNQLFALALVVGAIQIVFGMCVKAANQIKLWGWQHAISTFGWLLLIVGTAVFYGLSKWEGVSVEFFGLTHKIVLGVAAIGILFFNSPGKNPFVNFGLGLWDTYNMVTGLFGDILSYIRLFALGLSSAILGNVFNSLAFGMSPDIPVVGAIITIIILIIGHSINLFMSALGSLVHPMRLTFVEFYKNAGFTGGGKSYQPFQKQETIK